MRLSHLALFLLLPGQALAADIFVSNSIELEDAFEWANSGDVIWVAAGLYNNIDATNVADSVTIERETVGDVVQMELGKVNADGLTFRGIDFIDNDIEVQRGNFTYPDTNDSPVTFDDCTFDNIRSGNTVGGAMDVRDGGWVVIRNSTFTSNFANEGGAIGTWRNTRIEVYDSVFTGNTSNNGGGAIHGRDRYDLVVEGSVFSNNQSDDSGGAIQFEFGPASIRSSVFDHNWSRDNGGAISVRNAESFVLEDCTFEDNYVDSGLSTYGAAVDIQSTPAAEVRRNQFCNNGLTREPDKGGALALRSGDGEVTNNIFVGNRSERSGAGVYVENGSANIHNNTFVANEETQPQWGVAANFWSGNGDFRNNIVAHHLQVPAFDGSGSTVAYNLWWQNLGGDSTNSLDATNVFADPDFVGWSNDNLCGDDLHLMWGSAAIGTGDPAILNPDGSRSDIGAFGGPAADPTDWVDGDTDGSPVQYDCDDADPLNAPGFPEECDNQDNDCDGLVDDNDPDAVLVAWYPDTDFDGYGDDLGTARMACFANSAESDILGDCDDSTAAVSPDATEVCDGIDNNCDGSEDEGFADTDGDTIVDCLDTEDCDGVDNDGNGLVDEGYDDTDDDNIADCVDTETCDGIDNDGDGDIDELWTDTTGDGVIDCPTTEICDGIDNDQNGTIDDNFPDSDTDGVADCVDTEECDGIDNDGDGVPDNGFADNDGDGIGNCVDTEDCDGIDNDRNGSIDENFPDNDTDGIANCVDVEECDGVDNNGDGTVDEGFDNDNDGIANCFDTETCDNIDNDGDGDVDEGLDSDGDGLKDCDPAEREECDGVDNDGDGLVDDDDSSLFLGSASDWYVDD
ncbi:MAG: hypothetical protein KC912_19010, partial [Proteobacteria bacterium]|nr:hypothetical protein [Pseudomonadota bacterium]